MPGTASKAVMVSGTGIIYPKDMKKGRGTTSMEDMESEHGIISFLERETSMKYASIWQKRIKVMIILFDYVSGRNDR